MILCINVVAGFIASLSPLKPVVDTSPNGVVVVSVITPAGFAELLVIAPSLEALKPEFQKKAEKCEYEKQELFYFKDKVDMSTKT